MFRALTTDGEEVKGWYVEIEGEHFIIIKDATCRWYEDSYHICGMVEIDPSTLGLETGQLDKNKVEIVGGWGPGIDKGGDDVTGTDDNEYFPEEYDDKTDTYKPCGKYNVRWADYCAFCLWDLETNKPMEIDCSPFGYAELEITGWKAKETK